MPSIKIKLRDSNHKMHSISAVRQQIRRKLIEVGLQLQPHPRKTETHKTSKEKIKQRRLQNYTLPVLQSVRNQNLAISQFHNVFSQECEQLHSHRQSLLQINNGRGKKHKNSLQSTHQVSPLSLNKSRQIQKALQCRLKSEQPIPWLKRFQSAKDSTTNPAESISIIRLFQTKPKKEQTNDKQVEWLVRRSKTEERETEKKKPRDRFYEIRNRGITPWDVQLAKETLISFQ